MRIRAVPVRFGGHHAPRAVFPLTTTDPASELALKLVVITEAIRMTAALGSAERHPQVVAALIHASALADLADAIRSAGADIEAGLQRSSATDQPQEPPAPSGTPAATAAAPVADEGWITDRAPEEGDVDQQGWVEVLPRDAQGGWPFHWSLVYPGTPWRPIR